MQWHHTGNQSSLGGVWGRQGHGRLPGGDLLADLSRAGRDRQVREREQIDQEAQKNNPEAESQR